MNVPLENMTIFHVHVWSQKGETSKPRQNDVPAGPGIEEDPLSEDLPVFPDTGCDIAQVWCEIGCFLVKPTCWPIFGIKLLVVNIVAFHFVMNTEKESIPYGPIGSSKVVVQFLIQIIPRIHSKLSVVKLIPTGISCYQKKVSQLPEPVTPSELCLAPAVAPWSQTAGAPGSGRCMDSAKPLISSGATKHRYFLAQIASPWCFLPGASAPIYTPADLKAPLETLGLLKCSAKVESRYRTDGR